MTDSRLLLAACGLYCGACYHFRAGLPEGRHLLEEASQQGKSREGFTCQGCRSIALYIHPGCSQCRIRDCADSRAIPHCGVCPEFPCEQLIAFQHDGHIHHLDILDQLKTLREKGSVCWLAEQERRWRCQCESGFSWYETICYHCGTALDSYGQTHKRR
ncbi:MAG: DUF3795 domain-containing protein [Anaerolineae bacterium]|nr:DUF3795 domain-containing protein [Anaerolineae bacterium]